MPTITILHTNDFHNHLGPEQAERLHARRSALGDTGLLVDAGDAISAGNVTYHPGGEPVLDRMSDAGYDAMVVGNREFHFTEHGFRTKMSRARFPVLCANVRARSPGVESPVQPSVSRVLAGGIRVTLFGLTVPMITERMLVRRASAWVFDDPVGTAQRLVPELRGGCDLLVCLSHTGLATDRLLAELVPGIDLIVGGHTHAVLEEGEHIGGTLVVQAGWWGHYCGTVAADVSPAGVRSTAEIGPL